MRRMYSKEQLQKLIDEVSKLVAIEEIDKVIPETSLSDSGKVLRVKADGSGYELVSISSATPLYCHPITVVLTPYGEETKKAKIDCLIFNTRAAAYESFAEMLQEMSSVSRILATGFANGSNANSNKHICYEVYVNPNQISSVNMYNIETGADEYLTLGTTTHTYDFTEENFADGVNRVL